MPVAISLHLLAAVIWVGGMFFAYMALRPAAASLLEPPQRLTLWQQVFKYFFPWVWMSVLLLLGTGAWMVFGYFNGLGHVAWHVHTMIGLGLVMMLLFMHVYYGPFRRLKEAVAISDWQTGASKLNQIRKLIASNLVLGLLVVVIAAGGRFAAA